MGLSFCCEKMTRNRGSGEEQQRGEADGMRRWPMVETESSSTSASTELKPQEACCLPPPVTAAQCAWLSREGSEMRRCRLSS